jgi:hypothetical protein
MQRSDANKHGLILVRSKLHHEGSTWWCVRATGSRFFSWLGKDYVSGEASLVGISAGVAFITTCVPCEDTSTEKRVGEMTNSGEEGSSRLGR